MLAVYAVLLVLTALMFRAVPGRLHPDPGQAVPDRRRALPEGASLDRTEAVDPHA